MVDSREKGARAETLAKTELRKLTGLGWERVPGSGALNEKHLLKGDLYVPGHFNNYVVEVKHYAEDHLTSKVLTSSSPVLLSWWDQAYRQGLQVDKIPLLLFKYDRSKLFAAVEEVFNADNYDHIKINVGEKPFYVTTLPSFITYEKPVFIL